MTSVERDAIVAALDEEWDALLALAAELEAADWERPTACPGWTVKDHFSHVLGTESLLLGREMPEVELPADLPHVHNDIGRLNEVWVERYRGVGVTDLLADLGEVLVARRAELARMDQEAFDAHAWTPAGDDTYGRFMRMRVLDQWFHEQDVREAAGLPGHVTGRAPTATLDEVTERLGYAVGKKAGAPRGTSVRFELTKPLPRRIDVAVGERAEVVDRLAGTPTTTIVVPGDRFLRIVGGRVAEGEAVGPPAEVSGDRSLGQKVLAGMAYLS